MARPVFFLVPTLAVLLIAGIPFLHLEQGVPGAEIYPPGVESRDAYVALQTEFAPGETTPIVILADVQGSPTSLDNIKAIDTYSQAVGGLEGVDRVEGPFTIHDPSTGALLTPEQVAQLYALPAGQRPAGVDALLAQYVRGSTVQLDAISPLPPSRPESTDLDVVRQRVAWGPGPRASQAFMLAARARAIIQGRLAPSVDDVVALAGPILRHRMAVNFSARAEGVTVQTVIDQMCARLA